jgi:hemoglobin
MDTRTEIKTKEDIIKLVDTFYGKVNNDPKLSRVFNDEAGVHWESHLPKMYEFWSTQLLGSASYFGRPFPPHTKLTIDRTHFERWLELFMETVKENFKGMVAEMAMQKARNIAAVFQYKLGLIDTN